jgi:putative ABC transport system ATP-binding protein
VARRGLAAHPGHEKEGSVNANGNVVSALSLTKTYPRGREEVRALDDVSFEIAHGEFVAVVGPSGSGQSTLLNLLGCMDAPTSGQIHIDGREVQAFAETQRTRFRREKIGFVFQHFGLMPTLTVAQNIALPLLFSGKNDKAHINQLLARLKLESRRDHLPSELSGGEMQRTAIARALVHCPAVLLADEPTGNLDSASGEGIISLFQELNRDGLTIIVVTHNQSLAAAAQRQIKLQDGRLV